MQKYSENELDEIIKKTDGLKLGHAGNSKRCGVGRSLYISVDGLKRDNGNTQKIWSCEIESFDRIEFFRALYAIRVFNVGRESASQ